MTNRSLTALYFQIVVLAVGCDMGFDNPSLVKDLRILGLRSDPPEFVGDDYADMDRDVSISVLLADPTGEGEESGLTCLLRACVLPSDYRCDWQDSTVVLASGPCSDGDNRFDVTIPAGLIRETREADPTWQAIKFGIAEAIQQGLPPEVADMGKTMYSGAAVWVEIVVTGGLHELRGLKSVVFSPENPLGRVANSNPSIVGVRLNGQAGGTVAEIPFSPNEQIRIDVLKTYDSKETFILPTFDPPGGSTPIEEYMTIAFYSDTGRFSSAVTTDQPYNLFNVDPDNPDEEEKPPEMWSTWTTPSIDELTSGKVRFWFVLIDGRGGTDWLMMEGVRDQDDPDLTAD